MLNEACTYRRKRGLIYGNSQDIIDNLNNKSVDRLKQLALSRGLLPAQYAENKMYADKTRLISLLQSQLYLHEHQIIWDNL